MRCEAATAASSSSPTTPASCAMSGRTSCTSCSMAGSSARAVPSSPTSSRRRGTTWCARRPAPMLAERRQAALEAYEREPVPTWRRSGFWTTTLRHLRLDELGPRHHDPVESLDELDDVVREALGDETFAGLIVQRGASTVYSELSPEAAEQ